MNLFERAYAPAKLRFERGGRRGLALDIDDTLAGSNIYWARLIMERFGHPNTKDSEKLIQTYRYIDHVPYWKTKEIEEAVDRFTLSEEIALSLPPFSGSQDGVAKLGRKKSIMCYMTGRSSSVARASHEWLAKYGFPEREIFFKPELKNLTEMGFSSGYEWRAALLNFFYPYVEGIVDDNEEILEYADRYQGMVYLLGGDGDITKPNVIRCPSWESVVRAVTSS